MRKKVKVSAAGKIALAGEWAVLEKGRPMIVAALETRVFALIRESRDGFFRITIRDSTIRNKRAFFQAGKLKFLEELSNTEEKHILFLKKTLETFLNYRKRVLPCEIETWSKGVLIETAGRREKLGFGSSAAAASALTAALFRFYGKEIKSFKAKEKIYKIAAISHYLAQGKAGSGFDVAASTFGGILVYKRFSADWLERQINSGRTLEEIIGKKWLGLSFESLGLPGGMNILVGWTGQSSSTSKMIRKMDKWKNSNPEDYKKIISDIGRIVERLISAWKLEDRDKIMKFISKNEEYLRILGKKSGIDIETGILRTLSEIADKEGGAGKLSGAGGGDCGIAITFDNRKAAAIKRKWKDKGIIPLNVKISREGISEC